MTFCNAKRRINLQKAIKYLLESFFGFEHDFKASWPLCSRQKSIAQPQAINFNWIDCKGETSRLGVIMQVFVSRKFASVHVHFAFRSALKVRLYGVSGVFVNIVVCLIEINKFHSKLTLHWQPPGLGSWVSNERPQATVVTTTPAQLGGDLCCA